MGGSIRERESRRYEITHVPAIIRNRGRLISTRESILTRYERICFDKHLISLSGKPLAAFICPGHSLLDATLDLILEIYRDVLKQGSILVDENDRSNRIRVLVYLEHSIQDGHTESGGKRRLVSRRMQYVEIEPSTEDSQFRVNNSGYAPYLDYRPLQEEESSAIESILKQSFLREDIESQAKAYAIAEIVTQHLQEIKQYKEELINKTLAAVKDRLTKEINYWDMRSEDLRMQELAGKTNAKLNSAKARQRADELQARLQRRTEELERERRLSPLPPVVVGGALIVPIGLLNRLQGKTEATIDTFAKDKKRVEQLAMNAVMEVERKLGYEPKDVSDRNLGYDIESKIPDTGRLRFIEVKGRIEGSDTVTVTKNEILTALNKPEDYILALVEVPKSEECGTNKNCLVRYVKQPFQKEPDFGASSVNYNLKDLWQRSEVIY